jgi:16S rRNA (guanine966-N2)-methyltransferase
MYFWKMIYNIFMGFKERDLRDIHEVFTNDEIIVKRPKKNIEVRINAGAYANRKIYVASANMRPTLARTKSILFDILMNLVEPGFTMLDAFAGTGAIGLEALSRGSKKVVFVDINHKNVRSIERNLEDMVNIEGKGVVIEKSALRPIMGSPVDVVFLDPPYEKSGLIPDVVGKIHRNGWIDDRTILIIETNKRCEIELPGYEMIRERKISSCMLRFFIKTPVSS